MYSKRVPIDDTGDKRWNQYQQTQQATANHQNTQSAPTVEHGSYYNQFSKPSLYGSQQQQQSPVGDTKKEVDPVEKCHISDLPLATFLRCNEKLERPIIIKGLCDNWRAIVKKSLTLENLQKTYGSHRFRVMDQQSAGTEYYMKLRQFADYVKTSGEAFPVSVSDNRLINKERITQEYDIPSLFRDDLFRYLDDSSELPDTLKNIFIIPKHGGFYCNNHDGLYMSWTACVEGKLKFALFPRHIDVNKVTMNHIGAPMRHSREWFEIVLPTIKQKDGRHIWPLEGKLILANGGKISETSEKRKSTKGRKTAVTSDSSDSSDTTSCSQTCVSSTSYSSEYLDSSDNS